MSETQDLDPTETKEWLESVEDVIDRDGTERAHFLLDQAVGAARARGANLPFGSTTGYVNTIPPDQQPAFPGDLDLEWRIRTINRWNAMATVVRRNKVSSEYGGHIASFASSAVLYDIGLNHFWRTRTEKHGGDLVFFQGHAIPGIYARSFMEGRFSARALDNFRSETGGDGLSSYPHPWLMPDYWQFPTVSMGLGPLMAIYQARFMRYMHNRGLIDMADRKVWAFLGDGEMDEPESLGAIGAGCARGLDNLIFVVNCNLQRLDGPVRGNGKIIQELEGTFRGAGWNVIKLIWGSGWDKLLEQDDSGKLRQLMDETVDGDYQTFKSRDGAYIREHFFGKYPETAKLVEDWTDAEIWALRRGGHDPQKVYAAFDRAVKTDGQPTVLLVKTVKGYGMGDAGEGQNITHQQKKLAEDQLKAFRDRFDIPVPEDEVAKAPYVTLGNEQKDYILQAPRGARRRVPGAPARQRAARHPGPVAVRRAAEGHRRPADLDDDGLRPGAERALPRQEDRQVRRADRAGREPHLRHGGHVPPARHLQSEGPALHAAGRRPAQLLQGEQGRPGAAGGHQRGRRHGRLDRRGDRLFGARRADDPLLHLLLDVRLPAGRRPRLGRRATAGRAASCSAAPPGGPR